MSRKQKPTAKTSSRKVKSATAVKTKNVENTFCSSDDTPSQVVLVNADLKKLATAYIEAWHQCPLDVIEQELPDLCVRFLRAEGASLALQRVWAFVDYVTAKGLSIPLPPRAVAGQNLPLSGQVILPEFFSYPAGDIAQSTGAYDVQRGCDVEAAKLYLAIFDGTHFKRLLLQDTPADTSVERSMMWRNLTKAHECLLNYLRAMVKQARRHVVKIGGDLTIEIDGELAEPKTAAKRALLTLCLMRDRSSFTVQEFSDTFYGTDSSHGELHSEFTTAIRAVKKQLPGIEYTSDHQGGRSISNVCFVVEASDEQLRREIDALRAAK